MVTNIKQRKKTITRNVNALYNNRVRLDPREKKNHPVNVAPIPVPSCHDKTANAKLKIKKSNIMKLLSVKTAEGGRRGEGAT